MLRAPSRIMSTTAIVESRAIGVPHLASRVRRYRLVAGVDLTEYADIVIERALDQAARHDAPELHFVTVVEKRSTPAEERRQALWQRVSPVLETFTRHGRDWRARLHVRCGKPEVEITELAAEVRADLLVIGQFGLHTRRASDRNLPGRILQHAPCPTLVVGMPAEVDGPTCPVCSTVREDSEGERWFCREHAAARRDHVVSRMTIWSDGNLVG